MSQGLPVIGSSYGSLGELIQPSVGIICKNYNEFEQALNSDHQFKREEIRDYVEKNFTSRVMANNYIEYYQRVVGGELLHKEQPKVIEGTSPEELLPF